jgi:peroxiredoxin
VGFAIGILIVVLVGLFTHIGANSGGSAGSGSGGQPQPGDPVPSFAQSNIGPSGAKTVAVSAHSSGGVPMALLFFGNWCPSCHQELPPLAAAVRQQQAESGPLSKVRVVGVDSEDSLSSAHSFIASSGVTFPVAYDPDVSITEGAFYFTGDPHAVFVRADGKIAKVEYGPITPAQFTADERALIPSGR